MNNEKIKLIVKEWQDNSWTDGFSYECMSRIAELMDSEEQEPISLKANEKQLEELKGLIHDNPLYVAMVEPEAGL